MIVLRWQQFDGNNWKFSPSIRERRPWEGFPKTPTLQTYYESITSNLHGLLLQFPPPNSGEQPPAPRRNTHLRALFMLIGRDTERMSRGAQIMCGAVPVIFVAAKWLLICSFL